MLTFVSDQLAHVGRAGQNIVVKGRLRNVIFESSNLANLNSLKRYGSRSVRVGCIIP